MPLGYGRYDKYGYFDINAALQELEEAMMAKGQAQAKGRRTTLPQLMGTMAEIVGDYYAKKQEKERWDWRQGMEEEGLDLRRQSTKSMIDYRDFLQQPKPAQQITGERLWLQNHPGMGHEDYLRATKGIAAEFKKPKEYQPPWPIREQTKDILYREPKSRQKEIEKYAGKWDLRWNAMQGVPEKDRLEELPSELTAFDKWAKLNVPAELRLHVKRTLGMKGPNWRALQKPARKVRIKREVRPPVEPKAKPTVEGRYTPEQMNAYNTCRAQGGGKEECKAQAGIQ